MSYEEFVDLLERLVSDDVLSLAEAQILASNYDEFADFDGPLLPEDVPGWSQEIEFLTLATLAAVLFFILRRNIPREATSVALRQLTHAQRSAAFGAVQDSFQQESSQLARDLTNGVLTLTEWHTQMNASLLSHYRSMAYAGYGVIPLRPEMEEALQNAVRVQQAYLSRFADNYALSVLQNDPWSNQYIANRASMYAGPMRAFGYQAAEVSLGFDDGWVFYYIAVDDNRTCDPCIDAMRDGPYLAGAGPYPGDVCDGKNKCRCRREPIYDPGVFATLTNRATP